MHVNITFVEGSDAHYVSTVEGRLSSKVCSCGVICFTNRAIPGINSGVGLITLAGLFSQQVILRTGYQVTIWFERLKPNITLN
jgi:hypothetical protein